MTRVSKALFTLAAVAAVTAAPVTARADILTFNSFGSFSSTSNTYGLTQENVLTPGTLTGSTVWGFTNQTNTQTNVTSLVGAQLSVAAANGQARFTGVGGADIGTGGFFINLLNNATFTSIAFNLVGSAGTVSILTLEPNNEVTTTNYTLGSGSNFFGALAINGQSIVRVTVNGGLNISSLEQVRVGGITAARVVPEPSTYMLLGSGLVGLVAVARRKKQQV